MTKKDYELIAAALAEARPPPHEHLQDVRWEKIVRTLAVTFKYDNPKFNIAEFCAKCGGR